MSEGPDSPDTSDAMDRNDVNAALRVSIISVVWTTVSSVIAVIIGLHSHASVLVAFGAVGIVDAVGSGALSYHFMHGLRHDQLSEQLEALAHRVVLVGLLTVGAAAMVSGAVQLASARSGGSSTSGVDLAAVSFVALFALSIRKQQVARRISSDALRSDGHLSGVGAMLAAITLAGIGVERWLHWRWADAAATALLGAIAVWLAISTWTASRPA